ncbi:MAG: type II secretion system minor pseudopilin GspJ [Pseudomonadales bacterium]
MFTAQKKSNAGFTLIEVMVAIAIFAVISTGVYRVLSAMVDSQDRVAAHANALRDLQRSLWFIAMDMNQIVMRDVRLPNDNRSPALQSDKDSYLLIFTRQGLRNPLLDARSDLERVAYSLGTSPQESNTKETSKRGREKSLLRHTWGAVDRKEGAKENIQVLFNDVEKVDLSFMNARGDWKREWPEQKKDEKEHVRELPVAIKLTVKSSRYGELEQIYQVGDLIRKEKKSTGDAR